MLICHTLDVSPRSALFSLVNRWGGQLSTFHLVADSAFSGTNVVGELGNLGLRVTCSMSTNELKHIWELLENGLPPNSWRACRRQDGIILSVYRSSDSEKAMHHLIDSTFFVSHPISQPPSIPPASVTSPPPTTSQPPNVPCHASQASGTTPPTPQPVPVPPPPPPLQVAIRRSFTLPALLKMNSKQLRKLALENNVRPGGKKVDLANRIITLCNPPAL